VPASLVPPLVGAAPSTTMLWAQPGGCVDGAYAEALATNTAYLAARMFCPRPRAA